MDVKMYTKIKNYLLTVIFIFLAINAGALAQTLTVSTGPNNHAASNESGSGTDIQMLQLQLSADVTENIVVSSLTISPTASGLIRNEIVDNEIKIYEDKNNNGLLETGIDELITTSNYSGSVWNTPNATAISIPDKIILAGSTQNWIIIHSFSGGDDTDYIEIAIANDADVTATGQVSSSSATITGAPVNGNRKTVTTTTSSGNLFIGTGNNNPITRNINDGADDEVMIQLTLLASTLEDIDISAISFDMSGSGDESLDLSVVRLYNDIDRDGKINTLNDTQIGSALVSFSNNGSLNFSGLTETIDAGESETWIVVYDYSGSQTTPGETYNVTLTNNSDITATGFSSSLTATISGASVSGGLATISTTGTLFISEGEDNPSARDVSSDDSDLIMLQFRLEAGETEEVNISAITFTTAGSANESTDLDSASLHQDLNGNGVYDPYIDIRIGSTVTGFTDNGDITFSGLSETIGTEDTEQWILVYYLNGMASDTETFHAYIDQSSDITATGAVSSNSIVPAGLSVYGNYITVSTTGALTIAVGSNNPGAQSINGGSTNVTMMQLRLSASATEDIEINSIYLTTTGSNLIRNEITDPEIRLYRDVNNNGVYNSGLDELITTQNYSGSVWNFPVNTTLSLSDVYIYAGSSENWIIVHSFSGGDVDDDIELSIVSNSDVSTTGVISGGAVSVSGASLNGGTKTVVSGTTPGTLNLLIGANDPGYQNIEDGASQEVMLDLQLSANSENIEISEIRFSTSGSGNEGIDIDSVRLFEDVNNDGQVNLLDYDRQIGSTLTSFTDDGNLVFTGLSETVENGDNENWLVVYDFDGTQTVDGETYRVILPGNSSIVDSGVTSNEAATTTGAPINGGIGTISPTGSLSQGSNNPDAQNIGSAVSDFVMLQLNLAATATEDINVSSLTFTTTGTGNESTDIDSIKLFNDLDRDAYLDEGADPQLGSTLTSFSDNGTITFGGLDENILSNDSEDWIIVYYLNGNASVGETFRIYVADNEDLIAHGVESTNTVIPVGAPVHGNTMTVSATGALTIALGSNNAGAANVSGTAGNIGMMQLRLSASATEDIEINSIYLTTSGANLIRNEITDPEIRLYRDVNSNGIYDSGTDQLITTQNYAGSVWNFPDNTTINLSGVYIYAGTTEHWLIVHDFTAADADDNMELSIINNSDITATGVTSSSAVTVTGATLNGGVKTVVSGVSAGSLTMSVGGNDPGYRNIAPGAADEIMFQVLLSASSTEAIEISDITFSTSGSGNESTDLDSVRLFEDVDGDGTLNLLMDYQIGSTLTSFTNNGNLAFTNILQTIAAGTSENWIVVYDFNSGQTTDGETYQVGIPSNGSVVDTGVTSGLSITNSGAPINSGLATVSQTGNLTLAQGTNNSPAATISAVDQNLAMLQLRFTANATENIQITSVTLNSSGTADESTDIDSAKIFLDVNNNGIYDAAFDTQIGTTITSFTNNGNLVYSGINETISGGTTENWLAVYYLSGTASAGESFRVAVNSSANIIATGLSSTNTITAQGTPVSGNSKTVSSVGTLTMAVTGVNPGDENVNGDADNITMMSFRLTANAVEDIDITSITLAPMGSGLIRNEIEDMEVHLYEDVNANGIYNSATDRFITSANFAGSVWNFPGNVTLSISGETIPAGSAVNWLLVSSFQAGDVDDNIELSIVSNTDISATGLTSATAVNIAGATMLGGVKTVVSGVTPGTLTLTAGAQNPAYRLVPVGAQNQTMLQVQLSASAVENINITAVQFVTSGTGNESADLDSAKLFIDGDDNGAYNVLYDTQIGATVTSFTDNDTLMFNGIAETINSANSENWIVVYYFNEAENTSNETFNVRLSGNAAITATGAISATSITANGAPINSGNAVLTETGVLVVSAGAANPGNSNITNSENNVVAIQLNITAGSNENITISAITFGLSGTFDDATDFEGSSFLLYNDDNGNGFIDGGESQLGSGQNPFADNGTVTFSGLDETIQSSTNVNWIVLCNLNGAASNFENFRVTFANSFHMSATGDNTGETIYPDGVPVQGGLFTVSATGSLSLTTGSNNPSAGTEAANATSVEMLQLRLTASGVENISVTGITLTASGSGDDLQDINGTGAGISLYNDVNNDGILDGGDTQFDIERTYSANDGTVTFSFSATIGASSSQNWLVVYDFDGDASIGETFRTGIFNAGQITSMGVSSASPITETGFPVVSNYKTISTVGSLSLSVGDYNPGTAEINAIDDYEMLQFKLTASSIEDVEVNSFTVTHQGTGDAVNDIANNGVHLVRDVNNNGTYDSGTDNILASTDYSASMATFTLAPVTITANTTENWLVMYDFTLNIFDDETFQARFANLTHINLTGATSGQPITAGGSVPMSGGTMTVSNDFSLPVELISFEAKGDNGFINLTWQTASEVNNLGFRLERKAANSESFDYVASYNDDQALYGQGTVSSLTEYSYNDSTVIPKIEYQYRLIQYDYDGTIFIQNITATGTAKEPLPQNFELGQNYPNPFNPNTTIKYALPKQANVNLTIYNLLGQKVVTLSDGIQEAGIVTVKWNGQNLFGNTVASGAYFYALKVKNIKNGKQYSFIKKMILIR
jgi:uncharacterized UPF0146 family protein